MYTSHKRYAFSKNTLTQNIMKHWPWLAYYMPSSEVPLYSQLSNGHIFTPLMGHAEMWATIISLNQAGEQAVT